jgi:hypothetical protein
LLLTTVAIVAATVVVAVLGFPAGALGGSLLVCAALSIKASPLLGSKLALAFELIFALGSFAAGPLYFSFAVVANGLLARFVWASRRCRGKGSRACKQA